MVFIGDAIFKTEMPPNVLNGGLYNHITARDAQLLLTAEQVAHINQVLQQHDQTTDKKVTAKAHKQALRARK